MALEEDTQDEWLQSADRDLTHLQTGSIEIPDTDEDQVSSTRFSFRKLWAFTGPGFLMSIAYLDPGNIESDLQAGAVAGYQLLWVLFWATIAGLILQLGAVRVGLVTDRHLAEVCRQEFSTPVRITVWLMMETAIIGSDIQEVIGSAIALKILSKGTIPIFAGALITGADTFTFLFLEQYGLRKLEFFFGTLIFVMVVTFGYIYGVSTPPQSDVIEGVIIPRVSRSALLQAVGLVGALVMPHNIYLHSALVLSRKVTRTASKIKEAAFYNAIESSIALGLSFIINLFVVAVFANAFYNNPDYPDSSDIDLGNAGEKLKDEYGTAVLYIWAVGILAAGQSSTMTGTYAGQFVMEGFLNLKVAPWKRVLLTRSVAMVPTLLVAIFASGYLNSLDEWINILQSVILPFALIPVLHFSGSKKLMRNFRNHPAFQGLLWFLAVLVMIINVYLVAANFSNLPPAWWAYLLVSLVCVVYVIFVGYLLVGPWLPFGTLRNIYNENSKYVQLQTDTNVASQI
eukprot:m.52854 g.52854  ORF g.52854 m.52854 type:complete len:513 (-) comp18315_c1_seq2:27-1565(-)